MAGVTKTIAALLAETDAVLAEGQLSRAITTSRFRQLQEDFAVTLSARTPIINVMSDFGAVGDFTTDDRAVLQAAIDACQTAGGGYVFFPRPSVAYGILDSITLKPGVHLIGEAESPGYFDGWDGYDNAVNTGSTNRIKAQASFHSGTGAAPLIALDVSDLTSAARGKGYGISNLILDGNGQAQYVIQGSGASFIERLCTLHNVTILRAWVTGVLITNVMIRMSLCNIFANASYGFEVTCTDSIFSNNFIHSNYVGGCAFDTGSTHNTVVGGKIEENYGYGCEVYAGAGDTQVNFVNVDFQHNNKPAVKAYGGGGTTFFGLASLTGCMLADNGFNTPAGGSGDAAQLLADANGRVLSHGSLFITKLGAPYHLGSTNSGKLWHWGSTYKSAATVANTYTATGGTITADPGLLVTIV